MLAWPTSPTSFVPRCLKLLEPGRGDFFVVKIDAVADPTPPVIEPGDLRRDLRRDWREIVAALQETSTQEALDQVYRRVVRFTSATPASRLDREPGQLEADGIRPVGFACRRA